MQVTHRIIANVKLTMCSASVRGSPNQVNGLEAGPKNDMSSSDAIELISIPDYDP
jgi:hypothetical protein